MFGETVSHKLLLLSRNHQRGVIPQPEGDHDHVEDREGNLPCGFLLTEAPAGRWTKTIRETLNNPTYINIISHTP